MFLQNVDTHETLYCQKHIELQHGTYIVTASGPNNRNLAIPQSVANLQEYCDGSRSINNYSFESLGEQFKITCNDRSVYVYDMTGYCVFQFDDSGETFSRSNNIKMRWMIPIIHKYYKVLPRLLVDMAGLNDMGLISLSNNVEHILNQRLVYDRLAEPDAQIKEYLRHRRDFWLYEKAQVLERFLFRLITEPANSNELVKDYLSRVPKVLTIFQYLLPYKFLINEDWTLSFHNEATNIYIRIMMGYRPYPQRIYRFEYTDTFDPNYEKLYIYIDTIDKSVKMLPNGESYPTYYSMKTFNYNIYSQVNRNVAILFTHIIE